MTTYPVKTTNATKYDEGNGDYLVMAAATSRTFSSEKGIVEHARELIAAGNGDDFLIVKVVGRVRKQQPPVEVTWNGRKPARKRTK